MHVDKMCIAKYKLFVLMSFLYIIISISWKSSAYYLQLDRCTVCMQCWIIHWASGATAQGPATLGGTKRASIMINMECGLAPIDGQKKLCYV